MLRNPFQYFAYDLSDRSYIGRLPYLAVSFGEPQMNQPGSWTGSLPLSSPAVQRKAWQAQTYPGRVAIITELAGTIVHGAILWTNDYQDSDQTKSLKVQGSSFGSYLQHRVLAKDYSTTWAAGEDPLQIIRTIVTDALTLGSIMGGITIKINGGPAPAVAPSYPSTTRQTVDSVMNLLSQQGFDQGFDYSYDVAFDTGGLPAVTLNLWFPAAGRTDTNLTILQRNLIDFRYTVDATQQANRVWETGSSTGGIAASRTASIPGWPLLEKSFSRPQVADQAVIENIAAGDLYQLAWPVVTPQVWLPLSLPGLDGDYPQTVPVNGSMKAAWRLGQFTPGDLARWRVDPLAGGGQNTSPRFPAGMDFMWRITGWMASLPSAQGQVPALALNLSVPLGSGSPPQPPL